MSKHIETPEKMPQASKMTSLKINPRTRYLADLAATITNQSLTAYIENALLDSFSKVTLRVPQELEPVYGPNGEAVRPDPTDVEQERVQNEAMSIANRADDLWSESEFGRIESLAILAPRLVPDEEKALLNYIHNQKSLRIEVEETHKLFAGKGYKLNKAKINLEWDSIKVAFEKAKAGKGK